MNDLEFFIKRIVDLKGHSHPTLLKFLSTEKALLVKQLIGNKDFLYFDGGYPDAEYQRCIISPFELEEKDFEIVIFQILYNKNYLVPNHRMILGTLMSLGITRESIGDIVIGKEKCFFIASKTISDFIETEFKELNHMAITLKRVNEIDIPVVDEYDEKTCFLASLRLDCVLSGAYGLSRNISKEMILGELVQVNHKVITNFSLVVKENDIISVRGKGRAKVVKVSDNLTKSNRIRVIIGLKK